MTVLEETASCNGIYGGCHQVYGNINDTRSGTSMNVFLFFTSIACLE